MKIDLNEYADSLMKKAVYKCGDLADARDLVQETLLAGLICLKSGRTMDDPAAWLSCVLDRKFYDTLRRKYRKPAVSIDLAGEIPDRTPVYEDIERSEEAEAIRKALAYLTNIYRETMVRFYMKNESIKDIAKALGIPENTVKSRLSTGREHIRKELTMENYTQQSYEPEYLYMSCSGRQGNDREPFSLVSDDRIVMNLLILAYEKPVTVVELSRAIGISSAYTEPVIDRLVKGELMKRTGSKVYTDFIIYTKSDRQVTFELERKYADENYRSVWELLEKGFDELSETEYFKAQNERQQTKLKAYFAVRTLEHAARFVRNEFTGEFDKSYEEFYPDRPNGGKWFAMGNRVSEAEKGHWGSGFAVNGEYGVNQGKVGVYEYGTILSQMKVDMNNGMLAPLFFAVSRGESDSLDMIAPRALEQIDPLIEKGYFVRENGVLKVDIPVIAEKQRWELCELSNRHAKIIAEAFHDMYTDIYKGRAVKVPAHLDSVPEFQKYMKCGNSISMMMIMNAKESGLFLKGIDYPTPTAVMTVK